MKVTIKRQEREPKAPTKQELFSFGESIGAELVVVERKKELQKKHQRYLAYFAGCEVVRGQKLISEYGDGETINGSIRNYAKRISKKRLVFGSYTPYRKEIVAPALFYKARKQYK